MPPRPLTIRILQLGLSVLIVSALPAPASALGQVVFEGALGSHALKDELGTYYDLPTETAATLKITGPGTLFLIVVPHKKKGRGGVVMVEVTLDGSAATTLAVPCPVTDATFDSGSGPQPQPCGRTPHDLRIPKGEHVVGLRLIDADRGASVTR